MTGQFEDVGAVGCGTLEHVDQSLFEEEAIRHHEISLMNGNDLLRRGLKGVGINPDRKQNLNDGINADNVPNNIAQNRGGRHQLERDARLMFGLGTDGAPRY